MRLKYFFILSFFNFLISVPALAQEDDGEYPPAATQSLAKKKVVKQKPSYPTMEVKGICVDAATKQPLAGIMVQTLGDNNYTAMTDDDGTFTIMSPHSPRRSTCMPPNSSACKWALARRANPCVLR